MQQSSYLSLASTESTGGSQHIQFVRAYSEVLRWSPGKMILEWGQLFNCGILMMASKQDSQIYPNSIFMGQTFPACHWTPQFAMTRSESKGGDAGEEHIDCPGPQPGPVSGYFLC